MDINFRKYGNKPYSVALLHGGPGAAGEMAQVAKELSKHFGVLEPLQTKDTIEGQIEELKSVIQENGGFPINLVGYSWGAWLAYLFAAKYPFLVKKLVLVSSGPFEQEYVKKMEETRASRFSPQEKSHLEYLTKSFNDPEVRDKNLLFAQFGELFHRIESFDPVETKKEKNVANLEIYQSVWTEAAELRRSGKLLKIGDNIKCPVIAIHGDYDTHPAEGVEIPLSKILKNFKFVLLKNCGHKPWIERGAKDEFYEALINVLE
jgi:pimeloyl-ACP methyl ester carboxylesterase